MRNLHLAMQHNRLLTKEGVLGEQCGPAARKISQRAGDDVGTGGLSEVAEELVGGGGETCPQSLGKSSKLTEHHRGESPPYRRARWWDSVARLRPKLGWMNEVACVAA